MSLFANHTPANQDWSATHDEADREYFTGQRTAQALLNGFGLLL